MIFPFTAIVGQDEMKTALVLNVIDPGVGGLLIMGEKGTAKSTAVRALAELLPEIEVVKGCPFNCAPGGFLCTSCMEKSERGEPVETARQKMKVVELPLGVTEDRLVGALDIEHALKKGEKRFEPGLLATANGNFLYVDEVNLLEDHIVDLLLDSAAMGVNTVEREGISFTHPARFILVGTMNPEEGELRPQLLDRFGLCVRVFSVREKASRVEILRRRAAFDANPEGFMADRQGEQDRLAGDITAARQRVAAVEAADSVLEQIVSMTTQLSLDGHRADIVTLKAARALAAFKGKDIVGADEIREAAMLSLAHRARRLPFEEIGAEREKIEQALSGLRIA
jgi:magnesium chelatase subunit I